MLNKFLINFILYSLTGIATRGISLILLPLYTSVFTPKDYGIMDMIGIISNLILLTVPLEISQAIAIFYTDAKTEQSRQAYSSTAVWFMIFSYLIFAVFALIFQDLICLWIFGNIDLIGIYHAGLVSIILGGLSYHLQNQMKWEIKPKNYAISSNISLFLIVLFSIIFVLFFKWHLQGAFWAQNIGTAIGCLISWWSVRKSFKSGFSLKLCLEMLSFSTPLVISGIGVFVSLYVDRLMIRSFMSMHELGIFGVAGRFASIISLLLIGLQNTLVPLILHHHEDPETPKQVGKVLNYFLSVGSCVIIGLILFSSEILIIFTKPEYYSAAVIIPIMASYTLIANLYLFSPGLTIAKKTRTLTVINLSGAGLNFILNWLFIPLLGLLGAAVATLISGIFTFSLNYHFSQAYFKLKYPWKRNLEIILFPILIASISCYFTRFIILSFIIKIIIYLVLLLLIIYFIIGKSEIIIIANKIQEKIPNR